MVRHSWVGVVGGLLLTAALAACSGRGAGEGSQREAAQLSPQADAATMSPTRCPEISQQLVDSGRALYAGSSCSACHGDDAAGTAIGPNLADSIWIDVDGSYAAIARLVREGVPQPKAFAVAMPALGVAQLDSLQLCAVAAYTYSLGH